MMYLIPFYNLSLCFTQDSNETHDLPILKDFLDIVYMSREMSVSVTPSEHSFNKRSPLPDITPRGSAQVTSIYRKVHPHLFFFCFLHTLCIYVFILAIYVGLDILFLKLII